MSKKRLQSTEGLKVQLNISIPAYMRVTLSQAAENRGVSQSDIVTEALKNELARELRAEVRAHPASTQSRPK